jgi:hypothetical protein
MQQITGAVAEFERAKITERYRRGKLYRARCGEIVSPDVPFGYVKIPRRDGVPAHAEIQEAEAVIVRRIFDTYVKQELTVRQIAKQLTLNRVPTPRNVGAVELVGSGIGFCTKKRTSGTYYYNRKQCVPIEGAYGQEAAAFQVHITTQKGMDSYLRAADYRLGHLPCCGRSSPRERGIFSTKLTRRRLPAA